MIITSPCDPEVAFSRYYAIRLARVRAITPAQKLAVLNQIAFDLPDAECVLLPADLEAAFTRYYATRLAQAQAKTPSQKLDVLDKLERELLEAEPLPLPSAGGQVDTSYRSLP